MKYVLYMYLALISALKTTAAPYVPNNLYERAKPDLTLKKYDTKDVPNKGDDDPSLVYLHIPFYELGVWRMPSTRYNSGNRTVSQFNEIPQC